MGWCQIRGDRVRQGEDSASEEMARIKVERRHVGGVWGSRDKNLKDAGHPTWSMLHKENRACQ